MIVPYFKKGVRNSLEDLPRKGRPSTSHNKENQHAIEELMQYNRHICVQEISDTLEISVGSM